MSVLALLSWGTSTSDGEALVRQLIDQGMPNAFSSDQKLFSGLTSLWITIVRVIGPMLALSPVSGRSNRSVTDVRSRSRLHDLRHGRCEHSAGNRPGAGRRAFWSHTTTPGLDHFFLEAGGDQQLFAGVVLAAVLAAYTGRLVCRDPVYHGLSKLQSAPRL